MLLDVLDALWHLFVMVLLPAAGVIVVVVFGGFAIWDGIQAVIGKRRRARQIMQARLLDQKQRELRQAMLRLADALADEKVAANEAQQDLIRAEYLAHGSLPEN